MAELKPFYMLGQPEDPMLPKRENASVRSISREADLAWLAGIIDGEGCITVDLKKAANGKDYLQPKVRIINTDARMIQKCSRIYADNRVVFFYNVNMRRQAHYKDQLGIIVTSQGSCQKVLQMVLPYLANKRDVAVAALNVIEFVQAFPKGGGTHPHPYVGTPEFCALLDVLDRERKFLIEPSTTTRRAGAVCTW